MEKDNNDQTEKMPVCLMVAFTKHLFNVLVRLLETEKASTWFTF